MELTVIVGDYLPPICKGPRRLTTESAGDAYVKFVFLGEGWNSLPHRSATFWAGPVVKTVPIIKESENIPAKDFAIIPEECFSIPFAPLRVEVCGTDVDPDDSDIARNKEIDVRIKEIYKEIANHDGDFPSSLFDELHELKQEQSELNIVRKRRTSDVCEITHIQPGIYVP